MKVLNIAWCFCLTYAITSLVFVCLYEITAAPSCGYTAFVMGVIATIAWLVGAVCGIASMIRERD